MNTWFMSDPHYNHTNIVRGISTWDDLNATRKFETLEQMNQTLVDNINKNVKENDVLYCLGDWSFGGKNSIYEFRKQLKVKTIHLILGNHDHHIEKGASIMINDEVEINCRKLFSSVNHYLNKKINGQGIVMSHYSFRTWDNGHHGRWMLYGHSHGTLPDYGITTYPYQIDPVTKYFKTMDVGIDTHPEFRPYHFDEIKEIMSTRISLKVDHHNEKTT